MCGICGIFDDSRLNQTSESVVAATRRMTDSLRLRGPDGEGLVHDPPITFGHRRLSILDLTQSGAQPMRLGADGPVISYNGEVYNFGDLRAELEQQGDTDWRGHSDTEVILHAYRAWGLEGLKRLEGIFAIALWDPQHQRLVLMRDRLGVKPLFYGDSALGLAFASEIRALRQLPGVDLGLDDQAFREYLWFGAAMEERTFYRGIRQLQPGHWLIAQGGAVRIETWFRLEDWANAPTSAASFDEAASRLTASLDRAVSRQLVADVPVAIFLSGGVDSSSLAASARHTGASPLTITASFAGQGAQDEYPKARSIADHLGLQNERLEVGSSDLWPVIEELAAAHGEPFADAANVPLYLMAQALHTRFKVVLQGDGGDELFAGYRRYSLLRNAVWWRLVPSPIAYVARGCGSYGRRFARLAESIGSREPALRMARLLTLESPDDPPELLFDPEIRSAIATSTDPILAYRNAASRFKDCDEVQQMMLTDLTVLLPSTYLPKVDRATMAAGVEARVPLLDDAIVRDAIALPSKWKVHGFQKKALLRAAVRGRLPNEILDGPKTGFGVPFGLWLRRGLREGIRERVLDRSFRTRFGVLEERVAPLLNAATTIRPRDELRLWKLLQLTLLSNRSGYQPV